MCERTTRTKIVLMALAAALPAVLSAGTIAATVTVDVPTADDYLLYLGCPVPIASCSSTTPGAIFGSDSIGSLVPPGTYPVTKSIPDSIVSGYITGIGVGFPNGSDVVVALASGVSITGVPWSTIFPDDPESQIASDIGTGAVDALHSFFNRNLSDFVPFTGGPAITGNIGEFSNGAIVGSISANIVPSTAVPEPGTVALLALGIGCMILGRKRAALTKKGAARS
jgi:hypothetical protein